MLMLELLKYAATHTPPAPGERVVRSLEKARHRQVQWVLDAGLGPLLHAATHGQRERVPSAWRDLLLSTDLAARVRHGNLSDTANEILDVCQDNRVAVTLLKGISISEQHYPDPHLRPMGDIDILIPKDVYGPIESALLDRGYLRMTGYELHDGAVHGTPLFHPTHRVWVEIHTALFGHARRDGVFGPCHISACSRDSTFGGRSVKRLTDELQLLYLASSWAQDLSHYDVMSHPSGLPPLLDAVYLLKARGFALDCESLIGWRDDEMPLASLYVMLSYLSRRGICAVQHLPLLASSQSIVGPSQCRIIHAILDHYLVGGRRWNLPFPPPVPGRYSLRYQLRKHRPMERIMRKILGIVKDRGRRRGGS